MKKKKIDPIINLMNKRQRKKLEAKKFRFDVNCLDCGIDTLAIDEYYMVKNNIWPLHGTQHMLCIGCLEKRLNRKLTSDDFMVIGCNFMFNQSDRLKDRIKGLSYDRKS